MNDISDQQRAHNLLSVLVLSYNSLNATKCIRGASPYDLGQGVFASSVLVDPAKAYAPVVVAEAINPAGTALSVAAAVARATKILDRIVESGVDPQPAVWICAPLDKVKVIADQFPDLPVTWVPYES